MYHIHDTDDFEIGNVRSTYWDENLPFSLKERLLLPVQQKLLSYDVTLSYAPKMIYNDPSPPVIPYS